MKGRPTKGEQPAKAKRNADIIKRRKAGVGPRQISRDMGLNHNIVAGVLSRAGLTEPAPSTPRREAKGRDYVRSWLGPGTCEFEDCVIWVAFDYSRTRINRECASLIAAHRIVIKTKGGG